MNHMYINGSRLAKGCVALAIWMCLAAFLPVVAAAETGKGPMDEPEAYVIKLTKDPKGGKSGFVTGTATPSGSYLKLESLWATQPVKLIVMAEDKNHDIQVELYRYHWGKPLRSGSTAESGSCGFSFTHQGDVFIKIISPDGPAKVRAAVALDDEAAPQMKPILIPREGRQ